MLLDKSLIYSAHAQARTGDRAIYKKQVRRTLRRPENLYQQGPNYFAEYATSKNIIVRVVYRFTAEGSVHIVTAVRLGKLRYAAQSAPLETVHDHVLDVAYVGLTHERIAKTVEVTEGVYYDLDNYDEIVGVEILNISRYGDTANNSLSILERLQIPVY